MVLGWQALATQCKPRQRFLLALSGGLDSTVLLHLFYQLRQQLGITLRAAYVDHGLSQQSKQWQQHCQEQCQQWQIPFLPLSVHIEGHNNLEAKARQARYRALFAQLADDEWLLTGQHQDDQSETLLLALKRGSGPAGLAAMAEQQADKRLWRPLLAYRREQISQYAQQHQLRWVEDESNQQTHFDRNFLRLQVLPLLTERWPHFNQSVARSAALCAAQEQLLDELLTEQLTAALNADNGISITALQHCSTIKRNAILRRWLARFAIKMPSLEQLTTLWQQVALSQADANPCFRLADMQLRRYRHYLYLLPAYCSLTHYQQSWSPPFAPLLLPDQLGQLQSQQHPPTDIARRPLGQWVRLPTADEQVTIRFGLQGEIRCVGRRGARKAKKVWQELAVPPWQRERIPLLYYNDTLIAAVHYFITPAALTEPTAPVWQIIWQSAER